MAGDPEDFAPFIGSWTLLSYELRLRSGEVEKPLGDRPLGRILYLKNGQMSAQVASAGLDLMANADPLEATPEEAGRAWRNYVGYWGTYSVDAAAGVVIHTVEGAWFPNWAGQKQVRQYRFTGDHLTLEADSPAWHATLVWQRIE
jgi:lipocalin-like protein